MMYTNFVMGSDAIILLENKILIQKRSLNSGSYANYLSFPGGKIEKDEDPIKCLIREIFEETGVNISKEKISLKSIIKQYHLDRDRLFLGYTYIVKLSHFINPISSDEGEVSWMNINDFVNSENIVPAHKKIVSIIDNNKILFGTYEMRNLKIDKVLSESYI